MKEVSSPRDEGDDAGERPARDDAGRARRRWPASSADSVRSCRTTCQRLAPIDSRTAISLARAAPRASSRLAMLAQAISSTKPVTASSSVSAGCARLHDVALAVGAGLDRDLPGLEPGQRGRAHVLLQAGFHVVDDRGIGHVDGGLGLLDGRRPAAAARRGRPSSCAGRRGLRTRRRGARASTSAGRSCGSAPSVVPEKPSGATPMMVIGTRVHDDGARR